jgi:hypothetical protein
MILIDTPFWGDHFRVGRGAFACYKATMGKLLTIT